MSVRDILNSMAADNLRDQEVAQSRNYERALEEQIANLKMVCRRLAVAKTLEARDRIAEKCAHLFKGSVTRD